LRLNFIEFIEEPPDQIKRRAQAGKPQPSGQNRPCWAGIPLSPRRKRLFRFIAVVVLPLLLLGGLEAFASGGLRLFDRLLLKKFASATRIFSSTMKIQPPVFSAATGRAPGPVMMAAKKPADTYRIFILANQRRAASPSHPTRPRVTCKRCCKSDFPATHFEVVNLGITAINSHVILPIARDCAKAGGDLWIIYVGNNEMVGAVRRGHSFWREGSAARLCPTESGNPANAPSASCWWTSARRPARNHANTAWGGMEMFFGQ